MNSFNLMYNDANQETVRNLQEAERLMNLSLSKIQSACQLDLPLRRSLLISSVLNRAQRAAADAIASLDCSKILQPVLKSEEQMPQQDDIEMHILGHDLLSEILCTDEKLPSKNCPEFDSDLGEMSDNLRKRPRDSVVMESVKPPPVSELHDSKRLKEDEVLSEPVSDLMDDWSNSGSHPGYNGMWILPNIWTTPVVC